jgi:hypothetical protein
MIPTWQIAVIGLVLSGYAIYVEHKVRSAQEDPSLDFTALCDIESIGASCRYELLSGNLMPSMPCMSFDERHSLTFLAFAAAPFCRDQKESSYRTLGLSLKATRLTWRMRFLDRCTTRCCCSLRHLCDSFRLRQPAISQQYFDS